MRNHLSSLYFSLGCAVLAGGCNAPGSALTTAPTLTTSTPTMTTPAGTTTPTQPSVDPATLAQLSYIDSGVAIAGAHVLVYDEHQVLQARATTDATGGATFPVGAHAIVTVANAATGAVFTIAGVEQGDLVHLGHPAVVTSSTTFDGDVVLSLPGTVAGAAHYTLMTGASTQSFGNLPTTVSLAPSMIGVSREGRCQLVLVAEDTAGSPLAYAVLQDAALASALELGAWRTDFTPVLMDVTNVPVGSNATFTMRSASLDHAMGGVFQADAMAVTSALSTQSFRTIPGVERILTQLELGSTQGAGRVGYASVDWMPMSAASFDAELLPDFIKQANVALGASASPAVTLSPAPQSGVADATVTKLAWSSGEWTVVAPTPVDGSAITAPALPDDLAAMRPGSDVTVVEALAVTVVGGGYLAVRQDAERVIDRIVLGPDAEDAAGVTRYARY